MYTYVHVYVIDRLPIWSRLYRCVIGHLLITWCLALNASCLPYHTSSAQTTVLTTKTTRSWTLRYVHHCHWYAYSRFDGLLTYRYLLTHLQVQLPLLLQCLLVSFCLPGVSSHLDAWVHRQLFYGFLQRTSTQLFYNLSLLIFGACLSLVSSFGDYVFSHT